MMMMNNAKFSTKSTTPPTHFMDGSPICVHGETRGELMIPINLTYYTPQHKRSPGGGTITGSGKKSALNKNVQLINNEEEASVLSRYPFHGNRALPSSRDLERGPEGHRNGTGGKRWSFIDLNNNPIERRNGSPIPGTSESDGMLMMEQEEEEGNRAAKEKAYKMQMKVLAKGSGSGRMPSQKRQLTSVRSHSSHNKIYYKSPPMKRYSNVYDYTYMSDPNLKAIYEDSD